jgi:hypothetical protein
MVAAASMMLTGTALAQFSAEKPVEVSGTMVGNTGGAYETWNVNLPKNTDVSLSLVHWPCNTGGAVGLEVYTAAGQVAASHEQDACTQAVAWNSGDGGKTEVKLYNYLPDIGTWWTLTATGAMLPGAMAPVAAMAAAKTTTTMAATTTTTTAPAAAAAAAPATTGSTTAPAMAAKPAMAPAVGGVMVDNAVLYGDSGGAYAKYDFLVKNGQTYDAMLQAASPNGGSWPGVGFEVYGPTGLVASASVDSAGMASTSFTATGNDKYTVAVYNYHAGVPIFYHLEVKAAQ